MGKGTIATLAIIGLVVALGAQQYISNANYGNRAEEGVDKEYENLQNVLSAYTLKIGDMAQVPGLMRDDMKDVMVSVMTARQGPDGSKAMFQWFKEHEINLSPEVYINIQDAMVAGRNEYKNQQTRFIDIKATYVVNLGYFWKGTMLSAAGYPNINVGFPRGSQDDYEIVKSQSALDTFESGVDQGIKLGG